MLYIFITGESWIVPQNICSPADNERISVDPLYKKTEYGMIRKATIADIKAIHGLLQEYGKRGELLPRPLSRLYDHVRDFSLFVNSNTNRILGCCALQFCWEDLAEIRSMAVDPDHVSKNIGTQLMQNALDEAKRFLIKKIFVLTYRPKFFERFGFSKINRSDLPLKIWADCIMCVKFPDCDETAMIKEMETMYI